MYQRGERQKGGWMEKQSVGYKVHVQRKDDNGALRVNKKRRGRGAFTTVLQRGSI